MAEKRIPCKVVGKKYSVHSVVDTDDGPQHIMTDYPIGSRYDATPEELSSMVNRLVPIDDPPAPPAPASAKKAASQG